MRRAYVALDLPAPTVPGVLEDDLVGDGELSAWSPGAPTDLVDGDDLLDAWIRDPSLVTFAAGHQGRGRVSWAIHALVTEGSVGVYLQSSWGGANHSDLQQRSTVTALESLTDLVTSERATRGRVAVWSSDFHGHSWAVLPADSCEPDQVVWRSGDRDEVFQAARTALGDVAGDVPGVAEAASGEVARFTDFLRVDDVDQLAELATEAALPNAAEFRVLARTLSDWVDTLAIRNLLLHPRVMPGNLRSSTIGRALSVIPADELAFAGLVGLSNERRDVIPDEEVADLARAVARHVGDERGPVAARAAAALFVLEDGLDSVDVVAALARGDERVRHNLVAALAKVAGSSGAVQAIDDALLVADGDGRSSWLREARSELAALGSPADLARTRFAGCMSTPVGLADG